MHGGGNGFLIGLQKQLVIKKGLNYNRSIMSAENQGILSNRL